MPKRKIKIKMEMTHQEICQQREGKILEEIKEEKLREDIERWSDLVAR
jgi:hypothetical protein